MLSFPKNEIKRKAFHLLSLIYVFGYWYLPKNVVLFGIGIAIIIVAFLEYIRFKFPKFNDFFKNNFKGFYRPQEADKLSGLVWTLSGTFVTILLFPNKSIVFASLLYLSLGDAAAALVGKVIGKHKIAFTGKSIEGSLACFKVCLVAGLFLFNVKFALIGAIVATLVEAMPWKLNDNFWMQIINAGVLTVLSRIIVWGK
jgi:dolichol kinase